MKFYGWMMKHQDRISGLVAGVCLMGAGDQFLLGNTGMGFVYLIISATNLLMPNTSLRQE